MAKWMVAAKKADFNKIAKEYSITPVLARIMRNRDLTEEKEIRKFLKGGPEDLYSPFLMQDMEKAADFLLDKIKRKAALRVIGDYDADGICAAYILVKGISELGGRADQVIPHRIKDGYGLNNRLIEEAAADGIDTILTCDNGIAAAEQTAYARQLGMKVVVTDHHEIPYEETETGRRYLLPEAEAVVDPRRADCSYPFKQICGAVIAYKLIQAMFHRASLDFQAIGRELLPFAALATVCDVMELKDENRIIVKYGLKLMEEPENQGLKALLKVNNIEGRALTPYHAGFILGPCLNATGRLDTAARALSLFEETRWGEAVTIASDLKNLNDSRKRMTEEGVAQAVSQVEESGLKEDRVLVIYLPDCHESLAGIIAGKIKERFGRPAFVLTKGEEGIKGSGRSIEAYSMYEEMSRCKELFTRYGGHKMAAGLSMAKEEDVARLRSLLNENCTLVEEDFEEVIHIDVPMPLSYADKSFIRELSLLEPYGAGNPRPLFAQKNVSLLRGSIIGKNKNVGKYKAADENGGIYDMIYFGDLEKFNGFLRERFGKEAEEALYSGRQEIGEIKITLAYYPDINFYAGRESVQIIMQAYC